MTVTESSQPGGVTAIPRANAAGTTDAPPEPAYDGWALGPSPPFAHLTEVDTGTAIVSDWFLVSGSPDLLGPAIVLSPAPLATAELEFWGDYFNDSFPRLNMLASDGSLHWSDGTAAPDVALHRQAAGAIRADLGGGVVFDMAESGLFFAASSAYDAGWVGIMPDGTLSLNTATGAVTLGVDASNNLTVNGVAVTVP